MPTKIYVDMCADLFHAGHVQYLAQCKQYCADVYLIVGIHNDETIASYKRQPICTMEERRIVLESCKYVDEVVLNAPFNVTKEYLIENNIDYVIHADGIDPKEAQNMYGAAIELGLYREVPRTAGISTTDLIRRVEQRKDPWGYIWHQKGLQEGGAALLNGWEHTPMNGDEVSAKIKAIMNIKSDERVLEVGCGAGYIGQHFDPNVYTGIDKSDTLISKFKDFFHDNAYVSEADNLPFEDNSFEHVFVFSIMQYFPDTEYLSRVLSELERVAKKTVFIGDLREGQRQQKENKDKIKSMTKLEHLSCPKAIFETSGYSILEPWFEDYGIRYNVIKKLSK